MKITILGALILPLSLLWAGAPIRLLQLTLVSAIFEAGSSVVLGNFGMPVAMVPGLMFIAYVITQYALGMRYRAEGQVMRTLTPLFAMLGYALLSIAVLPDAFRGSIMVYPQRPDPLEISLVPLTFTSGNITQTMYLAMNVAITTAAAIFLTRRDIPYRKIISAYLLGGYIVIGLAAWNFVSRLTGLFFPADVLYSNPSYAVVEQSMGLVPRIQGPFTEPAALAFYLSGLCFCCLWLAAHDHRIMRVNLLLGLSILTMLFSTSTTGIVTLVVGLPLTLCFAAFVGDRQAVTRLGTTIAMILFVGMIAIGPIVVLQPRILSMVADVVDETMTKGNSESYEQRTGADTAAAETISQTYGLGVGWGSFRSSSFLPGLLANGGVFSVAMVTWLGVKFAQLASSTGRSGKGSPATIVTSGFSAALCGQLAAALLSAPTIGSLAFFLHLGCAIGVSARMSIEIMTIPQRRAVPAAARTGRVE